MTYTTVQGDMWDKIAYAQLGSEEYKATLMKENPAYIDTYIFSSGVVLTIPEVDTTKTDSSVPPWKRADG